MNDATPHAILDQPVEGDGPFPRCGPMRRDDHAGHRPAPRMAGLGARLPAVTGCPMAPRASPVSRRPCLATRFSLPDRQ
ncbi:MAG: hypothetical protein IT529_14950 [Burkholderiales bacterium]|nr:hypothetical protein [Burkholderiales bacterium]